MRPISSGGWTGGQYSIWRWLVAAVVVARAIDPWPAVGGVAVGSSVVAVLLAIPLAIGWFDRVAAAALLLIGVALQRQAASAPLAMLLLVHLTTPPAPYLSWSSRARVDPAGGWHLRGWSRGLAALAVIAIVGGAAVDGLLVRCLPWQGHWLPELWLLLALAIGPGKIRPLPVRGAAVERMYYDGSCGLCHRAVRFVLAEDRAASFRFAALQGDTFATEVAPQPGQEMPDSVMVTTADGRLLVRSAAVLHLGARLGGLWRALAAVGRCVPRALRDAAYALIARWRQRLFRKPEGACPILPKDLRSRFDG